MTELDAGESLLVGFLERATCLVSVVLFAGGALGLGVISVRACTLAQFSALLGYLFSVKRPSGEVIVCVIYAARILLLRRAKISHFMSIILWALMLLVLIPLWMSWRSAVLGWPFGGSELFPLFYYSWGIGASLSIFVSRGTKR